MPAPDRTRAQCIPHSGLFTISGAFSSLSSAVLTACRSVATRRGVSSSWSVAARRIVATIFGRAWFLLLGSLQIDGLDTQLFSLQGSSLSGTACHRGKLSLVDEVLEVHTRREDDVDSLDVVSRKSLAALCTFAGE